MATYYYSEDGGAPTLTYGTAAGVHRFTNFKLILKACLVTGFGARPAAGWTLIDEGDQFIVLRNASGGYVTFVCYYQFDSSIANYYNYSRVYLHASYSGMVGGVPVGDGVVSGIAAGNSAPQHFGILYGFHYAATSRWAVFADATTCILMLVGTASLSPEVQTGSAFEGGQSAPSMTVYFGDDDSGNLIAVGGRATLPSSGTAVFPRFDGAALTALRNPATGLLVGAGGVAAEVVGVASPGTVNRLDIHSRTVLDLAVVRWVCAGALQGALRGFGVDPALAGHYATAIKNSIDATAINHTVQQILVPSVLPDGFRYQPLLALPNDRKAVVVTDNPEFW